MNSHLQRFRMRAGHILPGVLLLFILTGCEDSGRQAQASKQSVPDSNATVAVQETVKTDDLHETDDLELEPTAVDTEESVSTAVEAVAATEPGDADSLSQLNTAEFGDLETAANPAVLQSELAITNSEAAPEDSLSNGPGDARQTSGKPELAQAAEPSTKPEPAPAAVLEPPTPTTAPDARTTPQAQPLDLDSLEARLRKTKAIGVFTKLELKGQVEDLVKEVDLYHRSKGKLSLEQLEEHFDLLVMKLLILVQDGDPALSKEIATARPTLWTALADPVQFSSIKGP